ncbi:MAG: ribulose-phosphate 3-epimerase [Bacteriovoracaceae bacterium]
MITIAPSLLSADWLNLKNDLDAFNGIKDIWFHLDIMDSHFVPNLTFGHALVEQIGKYAKNTPHKLDAHFMVTNPDFYLETFKNYNIHNFTFHWETVIHHDRFINYAKQFYPSVGISLNPSTSVDLIPDYLLKEIDLVLLMSVNPGFSGQKYISSTLEKLEHLNNKKKKLNAKFTIQVDGGVNDKNVKDLINKGATNFVAGNYIFSKSRNEFKQLVESLRA